MKINSTAFLLGLLISLAACNRNRDFEGYETLIAADWRLNSITENSIEIIDSCELDDVLRFVDDRNFLYLDGNFSCPLGNGVESITARDWKITKNEKLIELNFRYQMNSGFAISTFRWEILELNDSTLVMREWWAEDNGSPLKVRSYKR
jgi:hypothetical protein